MTTEVISLYVGTELSKEFTVENEDTGAPIDISGGMIEFTTITLAGTVVLTKQITESSDPAVVGEITDGPAGIFTVFFSQADTAEDFTGNYGLRWYIVDGETANIMVSGDPCETADFKICKVG